jgi:acyl-CoA reductase-like NAD-dependent aldehyde dehydrogenase
MSAVMRLREFTSYATNPAVDAPPSSSQGQMDGAIARLREGAKSLVKLSIDQRIMLVDSMQRGLLRVGKDMVEAGCKAKGIIPGSRQVAEEWSTGPWGVVRQLRLIRESLAALKRSGNTPIGPVARTVDGRLTVRLFPGNAIDRVLFKGITAEVRMRAGVTEESLERDRARFYRQPDHDGRVLLVLGAGNIAAIAPMDVITKMFNEGKAVLLKMNSVNAYLGPYIEEAFAGAIRQNFLAVLYGGADEGRYLVYHRDIDEVHITGSDKTHDDIVWGPPGPEREMRMQRKEPLLKKPITSELGNVSPVILVPGPYSVGELRYQAEDTATSFLMNASFMCCAAKMLVLPEGWPGSDAFVAGMRETCVKVPPRRAYYPGAEDRWVKLTAGRERIQHVGNPMPGSLPWTFISGLDSKARDEPLYTQEPFCSVISETRLGCTDPVEFLEQAVEFCNDTLWGTLNANLIVHPRSLKDPRINEAVERAIAKLRYGVVAVNAFIGMPFVFAAPPWGAYPGSTPYDIQSGSGFVHNTSMLDRIGALGKFETNRVGTTLTVVIFSQLRAQTRRLHAHDGVNGGIEAHIAIEDLDCDAIALETIGAAGQGFSNDEFQETLLAIRLHKARTGENSVKTVARFGGVGGRPDPSSHTLWHCKLAFGSIAILGRSRWRSAKHLN